MKEFMIGLFVGMIFTSIFLFGIVISPQMNITAKYYRAISECELNLPRTQHCKIIGVVDGKL